MAVICSFFGHRECSIEVEEVLTAEIERHITEYGVDTFYVGGYGRFDQLAAGLMYKFKERYPYIEVCHILAYLPREKEPEFEVRHHPTLYPEGLETISYKFAITHRNRIIVERSDYLIGYVGLCSGGAYEALAYAERLKKQIVNLWSY